MESDVQKMQDTIGSNGHVTSPSENLIDLNTPSDHHNDLSLQEEPSHIALNKEKSCPQVPKDENGIYDEHDGGSTIRESISNNSSLFASHIESGYLTSSLTSTSTLGREHDESVGSEGDITPCLDNVFPPNDASPSSDQTYKALAGLKLTNCDTKYFTGNTDLDKLLSENDSRSRPENLSLPNLLQMFNTPENTDYPASVIPENFQRNVDSRKRSKSSGFPFPRVKEGVEAADNEDIMSRSLPHGQILRSGNMIEFIADDLQQKIRESSPVSKTDSSDKSSSRRSSLLSVSSTASSTMATSMTSGMSRSLQSPDCIPPIDPTAIFDLEHQARLVADSLDLMMGNLKNNLHKMSAISVGCEEAYKMSVDMTCDSVDSSIKSMYALMAKCEQLSTSMKPVYKIADQIKDIKRLLDRFESQLSDKS